MGSKTHFWHFESKIIFTSDTINPSIAERAGKMSIFEEKKMKNLKFAVTFRLSPRGAKKWYLTQN